MLASASLLALCSASPAQATRPTEGGLYSFDSTDVVATHDGPLGLVRVHYSEAGPNQVRQADSGDDYGGDGIPDFVQIVAATAEQALELYQDSGLRTPLTEADMGLSELGGSNALDFYLVDFNYEGDGLFGTDTCRDGVCSGYMVLENDFSGYGYSSIATAITVVSSHELFHGVQYAYVDDMPTWMAEGTATWGEYLYDPDSEDFLWLASLYLDEPDRGLDRTPSGAISGWDYGTSLWFSFVDLYAGTDTLVTLLEQVEQEGGDGALVALDTALALNDAPLDEAWTTFGSWNLATGSRAGLTDSYPFAADLPETAAHADGSDIVDDERVYPLATVYLYVEHAGGELWFATPDDPTGLALRLHASTGDQLDQVGDVLDSWWPDGSGALSLGDRDAGGYWLVVSQPGLGDSSIALDFCLGSEDVLADCELDGGGQDGGADTGGAGVDEQSAGCGCSAGARSSGAYGSWVLLPLGLLLIRRRR